MSKSLSTRAAALAISAIAVGAIAAPAHAAVPLGHLTYSCGFPYITDPVPAVVDFWRASGSSIGGSSFGVTAAFPAGSTGTVLSGITSATAAIRTSEVSSTGATSTVNRNIVFQKTTTQGDYFLAGDQTEQVPSPQPTFRTLDQINFDFKAPAEHGPIGNPAGIPDSDGDPTTFDVRCVLAPAGQDVTLRAAPVLTPTPPPPTPSPTPVFVTDPPEPTPRPGAGDTTAPSAPTGVTISGVLADESVFQLSWNASTDDTGVTSYIVYDVGDGTGSPAPVASTTSTLVGIRPDAGRAYNFVVVAKDAAGNTSPASAPPVPFLSCGPVTQRQFPPTAAGVTDITSTSATLKWTPATTDRCHPAPSSYVIRETAPEQANLGGASGGTASSFVLTGLKPATTYTINVASNGITASGPVTFTTAPDSSPVPPTPVVTPVPTDGPLPTPTPTPTPAPNLPSYDVSGSVTLKSLISGSAALTGSVKWLDGSAGPVGGYSANLTLAQTTASLKALGFLPVKATIALVPTAPLTGPVTAPNALSATAKVRVKLPSLSAFGVKLAGGDTCQATQISTIPLTSVGAWSAATGGTLAGTFAISNLSGCGALNGLISPLTAGAGNSIALKLTPSK